ncbi:MAG TPA: hypothetical protein DD369_00845, partial [Erythrobacter sp.]|nr:hypothetical protein [Erythrobacter sp.]
MTTRDDRLAQAQKALQAGDFEKGMALAAALVDEDPGDSEALYMAAVAARYLKRFDEAERHLAALHAAMPEYGRAWQEAGHLARAQGDRAAAIAAFGRATRFNPAL